MKTYLVVLRTSAERDLWQRFKVAAVQSQQSVKALLLQIISKFLDGGRS